MRRLRRTTANRHRIEARQRRVDTRDWVMQRRDRTRHLIELGGLVQKAGLVDLTNDDRTVLFGAFLDLADMLRSEDHDSAKALWRRRGKRAFKSAVTGEADLR